MNQSKSLTINEMHEVEKLIGQPLFKKEIRFEEKKIKHGLNTENIFIKKPIKQDKDKMRKKNLKKKSSNYNAKN
mgnify:CR=1 FL=1